MTTLELFKKHRKGEVSRERFLYEVRRDNNLPWVTNTTSYDDAVKILKNKGIIREALEFEPQNITTDPVVDRVNPYALKREVQKILAKEKELTNDSYKEAVNKAAKKLTTPDAVKKAMFSNADTVAKADANLQTQEVKKNNFVDKDNGMKKIKGQEALKAMSAPTKENRKGKPKGVKVMPDKGVEGKEKVIKEISDYFKKKLNLDENTYHDFHEGMTIPMEEGEAVVKEINGGTLTVEMPDGAMKDVQMNHAQHLIDKSKEPQETAEQPINEIEAQDINSIIDELEEAQEFLRGGVESLNAAMAKMKSSGEGEFKNLAERIYRYMIGHIEPIIDNDHDWLSKTESIQDIIEDLEQGGDEEEFDEEIYEADDNNSDFKNGDKIKITSELSRYRGATGEIHDLHDDGTAMVILDDPKRTAITVHLGHVKKLTEDELEEFITAKTTDAARNADIIKSIEKNVTNPIAKTQLKKNFNAGQAIAL